MKKFGDFIVNKSKFILVMAIILLIPSIIGYVKTGINYDILTYLPEDIETLKGEKILTDDFSFGAYSSVSYFLTFCVSFYKLGETATFPSLEGVALCRNAPSIDCAGCFWWASMRWSWLRPVGTKMLVKGYKHAIRR